MTQMMDRFWWWWLALRREWTWSAVERRRRAPKGPRIHWTCCELCPEIHHSYCAALWHYRWLHFITKRDYFRRPPWATLPVQYTVNVVRPR